MEAIKLEVLDSLQLETQPEMRTRMNALDRPDQGRGLLALVVSALSAEGRYSRRPAQHRTLGPTGSKTYESTKSERARIETPSHPEFDASGRGEVLSQLVQRIEQLPESSGPTDFVR